MTSPAMKQTLRPQMSVSLAPGIISAAIVSVNSVMVVWIPVTDVSRSSAIVLIATFMLDPAKLQMNCARAKGRTRAPAAAVALTPSVRELVMPSTSTAVGASLARVGRDGVTPPPGNGDLRPWTGTSPALDDRTNGTAAASRDQHHRDHREGDPHGTDAQEDCERSATPAVIDRIV